MAEPRQPFYPCKLVYDYSIGDFNSMYFMFALFCGNHIENNANLKSIYRSLKYFIIYSTAIR